MTLIKTTPNEKVFIHNNKSTEGRSKSANTRWSKQSTRDLAAAHAAFDDVEGGLFKAFVDRDQLCVLKAHSPLTTAGHAVGVHVLGNRRVDGFKEIERRFGLYRFVRIMTNTYTRPQVQGLKALLSRHFVTSFASLRIKEGSKPSACRCANRKLFLEVRPMRAEGFGLVHADKLVESGYKHSLLRFTFIRGQYTEITHATLRCRPIEKHGILTEADAFECARSQDLSGQPQGLFVCDPHASSAVSNYPVLEPTTRPVDPIEAAAQFIVHIVKAYRKGSDVVVTLADFSGVLNPLLLKEAILRHPLKVQVSFAYLPCTIESCA